MPENAAERQREFMKREDRRKRTGDFPPRQDRWTKGQRQGGHPNKADRSYVSGYGDKKKRDDFAATEAIREGPSLLVLEEKLKMGGDYVPRAKRKPIAPVRAQVGPNVLEAPVRLETKPMTREARPEQPWPKEPEGSGMSRSELRNEMVRPGIRGGKRRAVHVRG